MLLIHVFDHWMLNDIAICVKALRSNFVWKKNNISQTHIYYGKSISFWNWNEFKRIYINKPFWIWIIYQNKIQFLRIKYFTQWYTWFYIILIFHRLSWVLFFYHEQKLKTYMFYRIAVTNDAHTEKRIISPKYHACVSLSDKECKEDWRKYNNFPHTTARSSQIVLESAYRWNNWKIIAIDITIHNNTAKEHNQWISFPKIAYTNI